MDTSLESNTSSYPATPNTTVMQPPNIDDLWTQFSNLHTSPRHRPPPPITIDNVEDTAQVLKRLQTLTNQKLKGRVIGWGLRVYPETPAAPNSKPDRQ
ncbi:hypothetical protein TNIN_83091 [Trichonephila inaurata madagascariensis]|uniref:Uncharacterized protein n=1 Tax=Trichonephila inaurata madagascariensis TaxID=2747483 RepID=A0A8X6XX43_9ARAC|nr:hypothetical protein TNIN_83091 [Trichonephila inaurata madagascariensis]